MRSEFVVNVNYLNGIYVIGGCGLVEMSRGKNY